MGATHGVTPRKQDPSPKLLRIDEAARELAVSTRTIWRLISTGELHSIKIGRAVRVTRASLDAFCEDQE